MENQSSSILRLRVKCNCGQEFDTPVVWGWSVFRYCPKCSQEAREATAKREEAQKQLVIAKQRREWRFSGPPGLYQECTFDSFHRHLQSLAFDAALEAAQEMTGLFLFSEEPGVGKTHLAAAIFHYILDHWNGETERCPVRFISEPDFFSLLRSTYGDHRPADALTEEQVVRRFMTAPMLILDDLWKYEVGEPKFLRRIYFQVFDYRYAKHLPMIVTANRPFEQLERVLEAPIMDRLRALTGRVVRLKGESQR